MFKLKSDFQPTGDQPQAIEKLVASIKSGVKNQVLMGVTGSGKTFTIANVIAKLQKPTLVISHNKTLAAQLYQEFKEFFPDNAVSYFVSYYDYYQPEAYIPRTDTYIEKETDINQEIDKLRLEATTNLLTRQDVIVVASVSCIYNLGSPVEYGKSILELAADLKIRRQQIITRLNDLQYIRSDYDFHRGTYRIRGEIIDIYPAYEDTAVRLFHDGIKINRLEKINAITGEKILNPNQHSNSLSMPPPGSYQSLVIYPAKHYLTDRNIYDRAFSQITGDLHHQVDLFSSSGKMLEAHRIKQRVTYDLDMIRELGYVNGIENYSRYFDGRKSGDPPYTLIDYFPKDYLLVIDESHISVPQIRGMYNGDRSRKQTLIDYGFRLPSALDNRPLKFDEFLRRMGTTVFTSATPGAWETSFSENHLVEQLIRPTGLLDPEISIRNTGHQIENLISEISKRIKKGQRILVTTLTKRMAEDLAGFLQEKGIKVHYLHSEIVTLERLDILSDLRTGKYDVIVGINLLREGLDLPEVSLVAILDADKEGFLRSETTLIQTMGRAARHIDGEVIMYADKITDSMKNAIDEVNRRRRIQLEYNIKHGISPRSVTKPLRERLVKKSPDAPIKLDPRQIIKGHTIDGAEVDMEQVSQMIPQDLTKLTSIMKRQMHTAAKNLDFELAAKIRDKVLVINKLYS